MKLAEEALRTFYEERPVLVLSESRVLGRALAQRLEGLGSEVLRTTRDRQRVGAYREGHGRYHGVVYADLAEPEGRRCYPDIWPFEWPAAVRDGKPAVIFVLTEGAGEARERVEAGAAALLRRLVQNLGPLTTVVHASTLDVYGDAEPAWAEDGPVKPQTARGRHKLAMEGVIDALGLSGTVHLRYGGIIGPGEDRTTKPVAGVAYLGIQGGGLYWLRSTGSQLRYYMSSEAAALAALIAGVVAARGEYRGAINVVGACHEVLHVCGLAAEAVRPWGRVLIGTGSEVEPSHMASTKLMECLIGDLGDRPLEDTIRRYAHWVAIHSGA